MVLRLGLGSGLDMKGVQSKFGVGVIVVISLGMILAGLLGLLRPISNGCVMTYMYPTYIPISKSENATSARYSLYLYHEGWRKIDFNDHLKKLNGVPVLFIPGNGGCYKQVRSLGAESDRAYQGGPLEMNLYQDSSSLGEQVGVDLLDIILPTKYASMLNWFAVDLVGEHSAMDGRILQDQADYVVYAIHRILDLYKESRDARAKEGSSIASSLPKSVILVGHSMGGFVARAAVVHPYLRKFAVETILTLSTPHQSPPLPLQPSLGHYYAHVNREWRKGYEVQTSQEGHYLSGPFLSHVVIVSISGGYNDYQVRSSLETLDGIVPPTHGFMISSTGMRNVWLSMGHQVILWCNQLVVQVSHTLLSLIDTKTAQPFNDVQQRLGIFLKMLHSGIPQNFISHGLQQLPQTSGHFPKEIGKTISGSQVLRFSGCPTNSHWNEDGLERDLYIHTNTVTVLAMDGRRRWLDIQKLGAERKDHFVFVTNLSPCSGVRLHLWREKGTSAAEISASESVVDVTLKMIQIPSGPAPRQIEPGSQTEQAPPSAVFWLGPEDMHGYRFLTISVAPRPSVSGRPPPAVSMGVGQFFNPKDGEHLFSSYQLVHSLISNKEVNLKEDHPLTLNFTFLVSLGHLPVSLSLTPTGCGIKRSEFEASEDAENSRLCKLRCFPPVALAWDVTSGLHAFPNLNSESIVVDSSPALWTSSQQSDKTTVFVLVDPHCSYRSTVHVSIAAAAARFLLLYVSQILGLCVAVVFFALMRQAHAWEVDQPIPSLLSAVESNLRMPRPFIFHITLPVILAVLISCLIYQSDPPTLSFVFVSIFCFICANGVIAVLILLSQMVFYVAGIIHVSIKKRSQMWEGTSWFSCMQWLINFSCTLASIKVIRVLRGNPLLITSLLAISLACFVHPALGLFVLLFYHALFCHSSMSSSVHSKELYETCTSSPKSTRSYGDTQLEIFYHQHGLLILHLLAALMFAPSLAAWIQVGIPMVPWLSDSLLCIGVILHGLCDSNPDFNFFVFPIPGGILFGQIRLSYAYLVAGYSCYLAALALAPYMALYVMAAVGTFAFTFRAIHRRHREKGETHHKSRKHSHKH
ncbi:uncharacterized protein LOC127242099 isoform X2 [Andrographis paniculata]|uniref:uncharacterized protein LOC127242099 isoform X2 n=1 Tax=Andrographis paniculata TaxID=175694 RepID=UPI0021E8C283|nr:uncharacterized protein LOC127242099 isoform X2 [Andrographis paniculata]